MQEKVEMECVRCGKKYEWPWKQFARWLRDHPDIQVDEYLCKECVTSVRMRTHGQSKTLLYNRWKAMFARTKGQSLETNKRLYLNKGIKVCPEWHDYPAFEKWSLVNGFNEDLVLDRIDGNGHYEPTNCRWVTSKENNQNRIDYKQQKLDELIASGMNPKQAAAEIYWMFFKPRDRKGKYAREMDPEGDKKTGLIA